MIPQTLKMCSLFLPEGPPARGHASQDRSAHMYVHNTVYVNNKITSNKKTYGRVHFPGAQGLVKDASSTRANHTPEPYYESYPRTNPPHNTRYYYYYYSCCCYYYCYYYHKSNHARESYPPSKLLGPPCFDTVYIDMFIHRYNICKFRRSAKLPATGKSLAGDQWALTVRRSPNVQPPKS